MVEEEVKRIDGELAQGTLPKEFPGFRPAKWKKYAVARDRLEKGFVHYSGERYPPDIDFLIETGQHVNRLEELRDLDKKFPVLTPDEVRFYQDVLRSQKELGIPDDDPDIITAKEALERYETRRKALYPEEVPPVSPPVSVAKPEAVSERIPKAEKAEVAPPVPKAETAPPEIPPELEPLAVVPSEAVSPKLKPSKSYREKFEPIFARNKEALLSAIDKLKKGKTNFTKEEIENLTDEFSISFDNKYRGEMTFLGGRDTLKGQREWLGPDMWGKEVLEIIKSQEPKLFDPIELKPDILLPKGLKGLQTFWKLAQKEQGR